MAQTTMTRKRIFSTGAFLLMAAFAAYFFTEFRFYLNEEYSRATVSSLVQQTADRPFQYRILIPWIVRTLSGLPLPVPPVHLPPQLWITNAVAIEQARLFVFLELGSTFALLVAFRAYLKAVVKSETLSSIMAFALMLVLPFNYLLPRTAPFWYPSDIPAILFFTLGLLALYKRNWFLFYPVYFFGAFNRETICFLTFIYIFTAYRQEKIARILIHVALQFVIWISIKYILHLMFSGNPGEGLFEPQFGANIQFLLTPKRWPFFLSNMGFCWLLVVTRWRYIQDTFARRSLLVSIPFLIGMCIVGDLWELRIYGELIPVFLLGSLLILIELVKDKDQTAVPFSSSREAIQ